MKRYRFCSCQYCGQSMGKATPIDPESAQRFRCNCCGKLNCIPRGHDEDDDREKIQEGDYHYRAPGGGPG